MNAERHYVKGEEFEASQAKLDTINDVSLLVEGCYFAAHHFIAAGVEWARCRPSAKSSTWTEYCAIETGGSVTGCA